MNIAIIEDHRIIREGLETYFKNCVDFKCPIVVDSVEEFIKRLAKGPNIDVILLDINLPGMCGIEGIHHIKHQLPNVAIIMLTISKDEKHIFEALKAGADGYLLKNTPLKNIKQGIQQILDGGAPISPIITKKVIHFFNHQNKRVTIGLEKLTSREIQVLQKLSEGLAFKNIAEILFVSIDTVRFHSKNIYKKLQVNSKLEAVKKYLKNNKVI